MPPEALQKLKKKIETIDEAVTLPELKKAVEAMLTFSVNLQKKTEAELVVIKNAVDNAIERISTNADDTMSQSEKKLVSNIENTLNKMYLEHEAMMAECDVKMAGMKDGEDADEEVIVGKVLARIPEVEMPEIEDETPESVRDLLEELIDQPESEKLDPRAIQGWKDLLKKLGQIEKTISRPMVGGSRGRDIADIDISDQLDGATKTFNIPAVWKIITVDLSSFPNALRKNIDYTWTPTTITFTSQIEASTSLAQGQTCIITAVTN